MKVHGPTLSDSITVPEMSCLDLNTCFTVTVQCSRFWVPEITSCIETSVCSQGSLSIWSLMKMRKKKLCRTRTHMTLPGQMPKQLFTGQGSYYLVWSAFPFWLQYISVIIGREAKSWSDHSRHCRYRCPPRTQKLDVKILLQWGARSKRSFGKQLSY